MYFLLINQFFAPDAAPTGQLLAHVAETLVEQGHEVKVVCGGTAYSEVGQASRPANAPRTRSARWTGQEACPTVTRVQCFGFGHGHTARLASYASFYAGVLRHALTGRRPDVVLTLTTPPLLSVAGTIAKRMRGSRHVIWEMDVYPDVAVALSVVREGSLIERMIGALADFSRHSSDAVIALGPCMRDRLAARGIPHQKLHVAENWVDGSLITPRPFPRRGPFTLLYSGNFGLAHDENTIAATMARLSDPARFQFVFAGGGSRRRSLEARCLAPNVSFLPYRNGVELDAHFGQCHAGLVTQLPATCGTLVPSKIYAFLAAGRPLIFVGPAEATPSRLIECHACGWQVEPGDADSLTALLELLAQNPEVARRAGLRARLAFLEAYERGAGVARICEILNARVVESVAT